MLVNKGERFQSTYARETYVVVGKWCGNLVLAPTTPENEECLIYSSGEIEELLTKFKWVREARCEQ